MSHRHSEEPKIEPKQVLPSSEESHPFLSKNDLTLLTMATPFLSANAQKLISFFVNFNHNSIQSPDFSGILNQLSNPDGNKLLQELLPIILGMTGKMDQGGFDPGLLTSLLGTLNRSSSPISQVPTDS